MLARSRVLDAAARLDGTSYFDLLEVQPSCDRTTLRAAFHKFALVYHPDCNRGEEVDVQVAAKRVFERGVEAYMALRDPEVARYYQDQLANGSCRLSSSDLDRFSRRSRSKTVARPAPDDTFADRMTTTGGRVAAQRLEALIAYGRFWEAHMQVQLLDALEPNTDAVRKRADELAAFLYHGNHDADP